MDSVNILAKTISVYLEQMHRYGVLKNIPFYQPRVGH